MVPYFTFSALISGSSIRRTASRALKRSVSRRYSHSGPGRPAMPVAAAGVVLIHDPYISGFEPVLKRDRLIFTTEIAVRVTFIYGQDTLL